MTDGRSMKPNGRNWRDCLTAMERRELATIEKAIKRQDENLMVYRQRRQRIQNRATVRAGKP
jgi:hypothetical protein